jgi:hypothetical protein
VSNKDKFNAVDYTALEKMSTQELKDLLRKTFDQPALSDEDSNMILAITEVLDIRDNNGDLIDVDVDAAWQKFQKEYLPLVDEDASSATNELDVLNEHVSETKTKKSRWTFKRIAGIAAALAIVIFAAGSLIPTANGSNLWSAFVEWTKETFGFNKDFQGEHIEYPEQLEKLSDLLREHGLSSMEILPKYIPAGYEEETTLVDERENATVFLCQLSKGNNSIVLQYRLLNDNYDSIEYQKNESAPEKYEVNSLTHYILSNMDVFTASWSKGSVECSIQNVPSHDELIKMINSIYEE